MPSRKRRGPIVAAAVVGAFVAGGLGFAGSAVWRGTHDETPPAEAADTSYESCTSYHSDTTYGDYESTYGWSNASEKVVLTLIEAEPAFYDYDSSCVLGVIEDHFDSPEDFARAADTDSSEITSAGYDVAIEC
jgi:hypothetical protein